VAYSLSLLRVAGALGLSSRHLPCGQFDAANKEYLLETGKFLQTARDVRNVVAGVANDKPIFVRDVAEVSDGEKSRPIRAHGSHRVQRVSAGRDPFDRQAEGHECVIFADNVLQRIEPLKGSVIPSDVQVDITCNYGETAAEKSNELLFHMLIAVGSVSIRIAITPGFRESLIVFIAIPVTLA
jgi:multidrug efflux pump subunit AcrB